MFTEIFLITTVLHFIPALAALPDPRVPQSVQWEIHKEALVCTEGVGREHNFLSAFHCPMLQTLSFEIDKMSGNRLVTALESIVAKK